MPPVPPPPQVQAPPPSAWNVQPTPPPAPNPPQTYYVPAPKSGLPAWLVTILVAGVLIGSGAAALSVFKGGASTTEPTEKKAETAAKGAVVNPYGKNIEIAGLRVSESPKQLLEVKMAVINHSYTEMPSLKLLINLRVANASASQAPIASFTVPVQGLGPYEVRDVKVTSSTKLRVYELPDWQFLKADFTVVP